MAPIIMIEPRQFREFIVRATLAYLGDTRPAMENLLVGTALQESGLHYLHQTGTGPALGLFQIEPATHADQWENWLSYRADYAGKIRGLASHLWWTEKQPPDSELIGNLPYACAIAWIKYHRAPTALPGADDIAGLAAYWKTYYNANGKGTVQEWMDNYGNA